jgi:hypothetical protein
MRANEPIAPALWPPDPERPAGEAPSTADVFIALAETFDAKKRFVSDYIQVLGLTSSADITFLRQIRSLPSSTKVYRTE